MKIKVKSSGEVYYADYWENQNVRIEEEEIKGTIDWDAFRREVAKDMLTFTAQMKLTKEGVVLRMASKEAAVKLAIEYADELIKQLKEWKK